MPDLNASISAYVDASDAFRKACREMNAAAAVVARWAPYVAKWRDGEIQKVGVEPQLSTFPSGNRLAELWQRFEAARKVLKRAYEEIAYEARQIVKNPDAIEAEELGQKP